MAVGEALLTAEDDGNAARTADVSVCVSVGVSVGVSMCVSMGVSVGVSMCVSG
jgi:hypothetical protein